MKKTPLCVLNKLGLRLTGEGIGEGIHYNLKHVVMLLFYVGKGFPELL